MNGTLKIVPVSTAFIPDPMLMANIPVNTIISWVLTISPRRQPDNISISLNLFPLKLPATGQPQIAALYIDSPSSFVIHQSSAGSTCLPISLTLVAQSLVSSVQLVAANGTLIAVDQPFVGGSLNPIPPTLQLERPCIPPGNYYVVVNPLVYGGYAGNFENVFQIYFSNTLQSVGCTNHHNCFHNARQRTCIQGQCACEPLFVGTSCEQVGATQINVVAPNTSMAPSVVKAAGNTQAISYILIENVTADIEAGSAPN